LATAVAGVLAPAIAGKYRATEVMATDGKIECLAHRFFVVQTSGPCDTFTLPARLRLGESFSADGKTRVIGIIIANQADKDIDLRPYHSNLIKKGDYTRGGARVSIIVKRLP
jgi:hypothetical protein